MNCKPGVLSSELLSEQEECVWLACFVDVAEDSKT